METKLRENEFKLVGTRRLCPVIKKKKKKNTHELHCDKTSLVNRNHKLRKQKKRKEKRKLALMSGTSSIAMLSLTYTKVDRGVADQVYSNALIDGYMNMIVGYAPWYSVVVHTRKQLKQGKFLDSMDIMSVILTLRSWKTSSY